MTTLSGATTPTVEEAKVEDVESSDEDIPSLEPATKEQTGTTETNAKAPLKGVSRSEKKSRKAVQRLGMKPFPGIVSVKVKKGKGVCHFIHKLPLLLTFSKFCLL
jgi:nascent polypeptide-associated complex subunit alpha